MIYYKYMYTYSIYPPAAGRFETSQLTQQTTEKKKKRKKTIERFRENGGREREGEKGRERKEERERERRRKKNSLLSSRRVWQDSKFLKTVRVHVERGQGRGWCTSEFAAIRDVRRGRETCLSKSLLERRMVGRSVGRLAARKQPLLQQTHPATFVPPQNLPPKPPRKT